MSCYVIQHVSRVCVTYVMLYTCHVMLCHVKLYNMCHVMLYNICYVMLYNICYVIYMSCYVI